MSSVGTEIKINVHVEPIDNYHMEDYDFTCTFYIIGKRSVSLKKVDMIRIDKDNYIACIDSTKVGYGNLMMRIVAYIPDNDFNDLLRTEVAAVNTGIVISA